MSFGDYYVRNYSDRIDRLFEAFCSSAYGSCVSACRADYKACAQGLGAPPSAVDYPAGCVAALATSLEQCAAPDVMLDIPALTSALSDLEREAYTRFGGGA